MNKLETLLYSLIKMGWKPYGMEINAEYIDRIVVEWSVMYIIFKWDWEYVEGLRSLVSLESGLWQFCADKILLPIEDNEWEDNRWLQFPDWTFEYRLLESALIPEEELGKFLVDNIKAEWKSTNSN